MMTTALAAALLLPIAAQDAAKAAAPLKPWTLLVYGGADNNADGPIQHFLDGVRKAIDGDPGIDLVVYIDRSTVRFDGNERETPWMLRVTEIFRKQSDRWIRLHRHADLSSATATCIRASAIRSTRCASATRFPMRTARCTAHCSMQVCLPRSTSR